MDKVSIIVPVYNSEKYLNRCISSIINQSYKNLEIILVNDGSTDNSLIICNSYSWDERIKIINKKNAGVSEARNDGLQNVSGKYTMFVDSDDWIDNNCVACCMDAIKKNNFDLVIFPYIREYQTKKLARYLYEKELDLKGKEKVQNELLRKLIGPFNNELKDPTSMEINNAVWGKLYRTSILKNIRFISYKLTVGEDLIFNMNVLLKVKNAKYITGTYYHYNKVNYSSLTKKNNIELFSRWNTMYQEMEKVSLNKSCILESDIVYSCLKRRKVVNLLTIFLNIYNSKCGYFEKVKNFKWWILRLKKENCFKEIDFKFMSFKWKVFYFFCKYEMFFPLMFLLWMISLLQKFF